MLTLKQAIEALVFASPKPLTIEEIRKALRGAAAETEELDVVAYGDASEEDVASHLNLLRAEYEQAGHAFQMAEQVNGWAVVTIPASAQWVRQLYPESRPTRLSGPALETLAIIAYRQPVTRADIEAVRGVAVDGVMQVLLDRGLVKIAGRAELPGRPLLYETTEYFLQHFGLKTTEELPNSDELKRVKLPEAQYEEKEKPEKPAKKSKKAKTEEGPAAPAADTPAGEAVEGAPATAASTESVESAPAAEEPTAEVPKESPEPLAEIAEVAEPAAAEEPTTPQESKEEEPPVS